MSSSSTSPGPVDAKKIENDLDYLSMKLAQKGIHKPIVDFRLGRPTDDSVKDLPEEKIVAGYYDDEGNEIVTQNITRPHPQSRETADESSDSHTESREVS